MSLRNSLFAPSDIWTDEIDALLKEMSSSMLGEWEVYERSFEGRPWQNTHASSERYRKCQRYNYPSNSVQFAYLPDTVEPNSWIIRTNAIHIRHARWYGQEFDIDSENDQQELDDESKYIVKGTFVDPIVTRSPEKVANQIEEGMTRVAQATMFNAEIERLSHRSLISIDPPEDPAEYTDQRTPVTAVDGVGETAVERLAERFGTYYNVTVGDRNNISNCLSDWHRPSSEDVVESIEEAINRYNRFRKRNDWDSIDISPDTWVDYPKKQPR